MIVTAHEFADGPILSAIGPKLTLDDAYSITSSAVTESVCGMVRPRALAVLRLMVTK